MNAVATIALEKGERISAAITREKLVKEKQELMNSIWGVKAEIEAEFEEIKAFNADIQRRIGWKRELFVKIEGIEKELEQINNEKPINLDKAGVQKRKLGQARHAYAKLRDHIGDRISMVTEARRRVGELKKKRDQLKATVNNLGTRGHDAAGSNKLTIH